MHTGLSPGDNEGKSASVIAPFAFRLKPKPFLLMPAWCVPRKLRGCRGSCNVAALCTLRWPERMLGPPRWRARVPLRDSSEEVTQS